MRTADQPSGVPKHEQAAPAFPEEQAYASVADDAPRAALPGALLLAERRAQGLSLGDVARQLKLSVRQVEALEQDDYGSFPGLVFVRGFLRNYAKLLRLDADRVVVLAQLAPVADPAAPEAQAQAKQAVPSGRVLLVAGTLVLLILLGIMMALRGGKERGPDRNAPASAPGLPSASVSPEHADSPPPSSSQGAAPPSSAIQALPANVVLQPGQAESPSVAPSTVTPTGAVAPAMPAPAPSAAPTAAVVPNPAAAPAPAVRPGPEATSAQSSEALEVRLAFEGESWVEIKDAAGNIIFSRLSQAGTQRTVRGAPPLSVVIGNAHGVKLSYRGKAVDLGPHTQVGVARLVLE